MVPTELNNISYEIDDIQQKKETYSGLKWPESE